MNVLEKAQKGNMAAFEEILTAYEKFIYNFARRLMGNTEDAEDITQEVAIKIYRNLHNCRGEGLLRAWIARITHNACMDALRRKKGKYQDSLEMAEELSGLELVDDTESPEETLVRKELGQYLEGALMQLPPSYRALITLRDMDGYSYEEVAEILSLPIGTVKSRLFRGRAKLKSILTEQSGGDIRLKG
ncbi:MAG: sigma-70 family RNA polymerase sigma factor [Defluviitaleaceae bacterium]|nr:sigma-70 family RNA polymerase sigma factor [Defluviitaleaceae bacterium]